LKIHLLGLPISAHRRLEKESGGWVDAVPQPHQFRSTPSSTNDGAPLTVREVKDLRAAVGEGFTHVVIPGSRNWTVVLEILQFDCRVHMARLREPIRDITWEKVKNSLHMAAKLDEIWLRKLAPSDLRHPLLLPPSMFGTTRDTERYWHRCDAYSAAEIAKAERLLQIVEREHRRTDSSGVRSWVDGRRLRFKFDPSKHAVSDASRKGGKDYRFCYELIPGFHYDVTDSDGKRFRIIDINGNSVLVDHCNVTPWGRVRKS
jgi:hypothetical protein